MASPWEQAKAKQKISAPKESKYHGYQGQSGGISSVPSSGKKDAFVNLQRQKFFGDRKDIPEERVLRRTRQEGGVNQFKQALIDSGRVLKDSKGNPVMNPNTGEPVYLTEFPGGRSVGDVSRDFAYRFGPTPKEIMGDIGYGASKMLQAYGIPFVSTATKIGSAVSDAWNKLRDYFGTGSQTQAQGIETQFPQPTSDMKDYFSSMGVDTGIAATNPNDMLVQIAMENANKDYSDNRTLEEKLANATALNLSIPSPTSVLEKAVDYYDAAQRGVNLNTPVGEVNLNALNQSANLGNYLPLSDNFGIGYGGSYNFDDNSYNLGIGTQLPYGVGLSAGISSNDAPGASISKSFPLNIGTNSPAIVTPYFGASPAGNTLGVNTTIDLLKSIYPTSNIGFPVNIGASVNDTGNFVPRVSLSLPFNSGDGLGYMFK